MLLKLLTVLTLLFFTSTTGYSQLTDTTAVVELTDSVVFHSPKKAALLSAMLPGLGQVYNKKYWKLPIIYVAIAGLTYSFIFNQSEYVNYRNAYKLRVDGDTTTIDKYQNIYSTPALFDIQAQYNRYRDLTVIGFGLVYLLTIMDATVDAHLFTFDVTDKLSIHIVPQISYMAAINNYKTGLSIHLKF